MKTIFYKADERGYANHGWLKSHHTFSFANYFDENKINFGMLRVVNDDEVLGGGAFGLHPHRDMEIISIPLKGALLHSDNMGNTGIINKGDIQVMSAGTGIMHSEENASASEVVKFLQIWIIPNEVDVKPRYDQINFKENLIPNQFTQIVSPNPDDDGLWIHQDAWLHWGSFNDDVTITYDIKKSGNGIFIFVLEGSVNVEEIDLSKRDALGILEVDNIRLDIGKNSEILIIEVPTELSK